MQLPIFEDLAPIPPSDEGWSDSDEDEFDQSGEYTGKFRMVTVPIKEDSPPPKIKQRNDAWGRPLSPFPYTLQLENSLPLTEEGDEDILETVNAVPSNRYESMNNVTQEVAPYRSDAVAGDEADVERAGGIDRTGDPARGTGGP